MIFKHNNHEPNIVAADEIPEPYQHLLIPCARLRYTQLSFGTVLSQEVVEDGFTLWQHHFFIERPCTFHACNHTSLVTINYMMRGSPEGTLAGVGKVALTEGSYQFFYVPAGEHPVTMGKGDYHCLHINLSEVFFKQLVEAAPDMQQLVDAFERDMGNGISKYVGEIDDSTFAILSDITGCISPGPQAAIYFQLKVRELILAYIQKATEADDTTQKLPAKYVLLIKEVENYIRGNLRDDLSIASLSNRFNMSQSNLQRKFKIFKRKNISCFIRDIKLSTAKRLLKEGMFTISEIAEQVGYKSVSGFTHAFTQKFKCPPSDFLKGRKMAFDHF